MNQRQWLRGKSVRFFYNDKKSLFYACENRRKHYYSEKMRGFELYKNGLTGRGQKLANSYLLDRLSFDLDDIVIDCGANYSDLFLFLESRISPQNYHTFEPSEREFKCVQLNAATSKNNNIGLYKTTGQTEFYLASDEGDSSILEPSDGYKKKITIDTMSLDDYFSASRFSTVKLLKLEAEGLEPEILAGAKNALKKIEYVAADGGEERGLRGDETLSSITNSLLKNDFELVGIDISSKMGRALFKNKKL